MDQTNVERLFGASKRVFSATCADCGALYIQPVRQGLRPVRCPACRLDRIRARSKRQHIERQATKPRIQTFNCTACGGAFENPRKRKFCIPCADAKERARWKAKNEAKKAIRAAEGRTRIERTPEEREAIRRANRRGQREREKERRRAASEPARKARLAAIEAKRVAALAEKEERRRKREEWESLPWGRPGLSDTERYRIRYKLDPDYNLKEKLRLYERKQKFGRYGDAMRSAIKGGTRSPIVERAFGYTIDDLKRHLERQFTKGMSWQRFCAGDIHIDHIRPLSSFDMTDFDQVKEAWALTNLRPLWAKDNLQKHAKCLFLI